MNETHRIITKWNRRFLVTATFASTAEAAPPIAVSPFWPAVDELCTHAPRLATLNPAVLSGQTRMGAIVALRAPLGLSRPAPEQPAARHRDNGAYFGRACGKVGHTDSRASRPDIAFTRPAGMARSNSRAADQSALMSCRDVSRTGGSRRDDHGHPDQVAA